MRYLLLSILFTLPLLSSAASFTFESGDIAVGSEGIVTLYVVPEGETVYTAQAVIAFDEAQLSVSNVVVSSELRELSKEGYDGQVNGQITKTAGFPGGVSAKTALLSFTVTRKAGGVGVIAVEGTSTIYNAIGENVARGFGTKVFAAVPKKSVAAASLPPAFSISEDAKEVVISKEKDSVGASLIDEQSKIALPAAVITIESRFPVVPLAILLLVIIMMLWVYIRIKSRRNMLAKSDIR